MRTDKQQQKTTLSANPAEARKNDILKKLAKKTEQGVENNLQPRQANMEDKSTRADYTTAQTSKTTIKTTPGARTTAQPGYAAQPAYAAQPGYAVPQNAFSPAYGQAEAAEASPAVPNVESDGKNPSQLDKDARISSRYAIVDNMKGLMVIFYMLAQFMIFIPASFSKHDIVYHSSQTGTDLPFFNFFNMMPLDLGPIAFFFLIGIIMYKVFDRSVEREGKAAYKRFFIKNAAIIGIFSALLFMVNAVTNDDMDWQTVHSIGFTGILLMFTLLPKIRRNAWVRLAVGVGILALYTVFKSQIDLFTGTQGGIAACVGFAGAVLISSFLGDVSRKNLGLYAIATAALFGVAIGLKYLLGEALYQSYNTTYIAFGLAWVNLLYFIFCIIDKLFLKNRPIPIIATFGRNIFLYLLLTLVLDGVCELFVPTLNAWQVGIALAIVVSIYVLISLPLAKTKTLFKL
ncbi:MAG: hypothetical protein LBT55_03760 [Clostridiaceae bacterium]|jgi:hypothetical protein|nr:hypothetical protein [Clostridiaceae bacterium]